MKKSGQQTRGEEGIFWTKETAQCKARGFESTRGVYRTRRAQVARLEGQEAGWMAKGSRIRSLESEGPGLQPHSSS